MRLFTITILFCLFSVTLHAQQQVSVQLKNGKVIKGTLVNSVFEDFITIQYSELEREDIAVERIASIHFGGSELLDKENSTIERPYFKREKGFFHLIDFQLLFGQDSNNYGYTNVSFHTVNGYTLNNRLMLGLGTGLDKYGDFMMTPVYASIRGLIIERKVSPYYYLNTGWGFLWNPKDQEDWIDYQESHGGFYLQPGLGYQINMKESALTLSAGFRFQKTSMSYTMRGWDWGGQSETVIDEERLLRRFVVSFGFTF